VFNANKTPLRSSMQGSFLDGMAMVLGLAASESAVGQTAEPFDRRRPAPGFHLGARLGVSYYGGDLEAANAESEAARRAFAGELIWHPSPRWGLVLGYQEGEYARILDTVELQTAQVLIRFSPSIGILSPYFQAGAHRTYGGFDTASGPAGGIGLSFGITRKFYVFAETSINFAFPDDAIDGADDASSFDLLGFVGGGIRVANLGVRYAREPVIESVSGSKTLIAGTEREFQLLFRNRSRGPALVRWDFADGTVRDGNPVYHAYRVPGTYQVLISVENAGGIARGIVEYDVIASEPERAEPVTEMLERTEAPIDTTVALVTDEESRADLPDVDVDDVQSDTTGTGVGQISDQVVIPPSPLVSDSLFEAGRAQVAVDTLEVDTEQHEPETRLVRVLPDDFVDPDTTTSPIIVRRFLTSGYTWVVASYPDPEEADRQMLGYMSQGYPAEVFPANVRGTRYYRVTIGEYETRAEARRARGGDLPPDAPADSWLLAFTR
jgi:hypothetical protein